MTINPAQEFLSVPLSPDEPFEPMDDYNFSTKKGPIWQPIANYPDLVSDYYEINDRGKVRAVRTGTILKPNRQGKYLWLALKSQSGSTTSARVDKLVLATFDRWEPLMSPEHLDDDTLNNRADNLRWRDPTSTELGALRAQEERRQGIRHSRVGVTRTRSKKVDAPKRGKVSTPPSSIQVTRKYSFEDVTIEVAEDGALMSMHPDPNRGALTAHQTMILCQLMARIHEMNTVLGVR